MVKKHSKSKKGQPPTISLCMIVKDEEGFLPQCLESVCKWVDEIIVVDTGSVDKTVEIAKTFGAKIYPHPWENDFSKHRNQSISYASSDWILIMDADEQLDQGEGMKLRTLVSQCKDGINKIYFTVKDIIDNKISMVTNSIRMFRNHSGARYEGIVHNLLVLPDGESLKSDISLYHYGYGLTEEAREEKFKRTYSLLLKQLEENPENPYALYNLATTLLHKDPEKSIEYGGRLLALLKQKRKAPVFYINIFYVTAVAFIKTGNYTKAIEACTDAIDLFPQYVDAYWILSELYFEKREYLKVIDYGNEFLSRLDGYLQNREELSDLFVYSYDKEDKVRLRLGLSHLYSNNFIEAEKHLKRYFDNQESPYDVTESILSHLRKHAQNYLMLKDQIVQWAKEVSSERKIMKNESNPSIHFDSFSFDPAKARPRISLCMIVKNEEDCLLRCLQSVKDYVDEIVVVDTGSTDSTVDIAERFGAKVYQHEWEDDFSKHRNQSIQYATGDWFLILDADEEIVEGTGPLIREAVKNTDADSITFHVTSRYAGDKNSVHNQERLFRNQEDIHYEGRIHNRIVGTKSTCIYPIKILHHGYNVSGENGKIKHERRVRILNKEIETNPEDPTYHHYLAASYLSLPDYERAAQKGLEAIRLAEAKNQLDRPLFAWTYYIAANALYHSGRTEEGGAICQKGIDRFPDDLDLHYMACQLAFEQKKMVLLYSHASNYLEIHENITKNANQKRILHCTSISLMWKIWFFLAMTHLQKGRQKDFQDALQKALAASEKKSDVYHAMGRYYMENGDLPMAEQELSSALETDPFNQDILFSQIELYIRTGDENREIEKWRELLSRFPDKKEKMIQQTEKALDEDRLIDARKFLSALLEKYRDEAPVFRLTVQYARRNHSPELEIQYLEKLQRMDHLNNAEIKRLGFLLFRQLRLDHADVYMRQTMESAPAEPAPYVCLAAIRWRKNDMEGCIQALDQALCLMNVRCDMEISQIHELGAVFALIGGKLLDAADAEAACMAYEAAIEMKCHLPEVYLGKAKALQKAGMPGESLAYLKSRLKTTDDPAPLLQLMGDMYHKLGQSRAADFCYQRSRGFMSNPPIEPPA